MQLCPYTQCGIDIKRFKIVNEKSREGGFGLVYIIQDIQTEKIYAAKIINRVINEECLNREIGILMFANHPTIVKFIGFSLRDFHDRANTTIIMQLAEKGSLSDVLEQIQSDNIPEDYTNTIRQIILIGVSRGMKYLHDRDIIHRDLKPGNVLLNDEYQPLITDFGLSKFLQYDHSKSQSNSVGTLPYMAPEVISDTKYGRKADVYSFGVLMYEVVTDSIPYPEYLNGELNQYRFQYKILNDNYRPKFDKPIKKPIQELIEQCWSANPDDRPTFSELFEKLSNKKEDKKYFLDDVDSEKVKLYVESVTKISDRIEKLNLDIETLEKENHKLMESNEQITIEKQKLESEKDQLTTEIQKLKDEHKLFVNQNIQNFMGKKCFKLDPHVNIIKKLGNGSFGEVFLIEKTETRIRFATKLSYESYLKNDQEMYTSLLVNLSNPAILQIVDIRHINIFNDTRMAITTSFLGRSRPLNDVLRNGLSQTAQYIILLGTALGMQYLHSHDIVHGNLKPENIFIDLNYHPIISDFGLSKLIKNNFLNTNSIAFIAPEFFELRKIDFKSDVYSYAMVAYMLLTGEMPSLNNSFSFLKWSRFDLSKIKDKKVRNFIQKCMSTNPKERPSFDQIIDTLIDENFYSLFNIDCLKVLLYLEPFESEQTQTHQLYEKLLQKVQLSEIQEAKKSGFKVVLLGNTMAGKTALITSYLSGKKVLDTESTVGINKHDVNLMHDTVLLSIFDSPGHECYYTLLPMYLRGSDAIVYFTDVNNQGEYKNLQPILNEVSKCKIGANTLFYLAATKTELGWNNTKEEIQSFANENNMTLFETSLDDLNTIDSMFHRIALDLTGKQQTSENCFIQ